MADSRPPVTEEPRPVDERQASELEREERRLERLRLIVNRERFNDFEPDPQEAA
jgi:hypothetical protein